MKPRATPPCSSRLRLVPFAGLTLCASLAGCAAPQSVEGTVASSSGGELTEPQRRAATAAPTAAPSRADAPPGAAPGAEPPAPQVEAPTAVPPAAPDPAALGQNFDARLADFMRRLQGARSPVRLCPTMTKRWKAQGVSDAFAQLKKAEAALKRINPVPAVSCLGGEVERCMVRETAGYLGHLISCGLNLPDNRLEASRLLSSVFSANEIFSRLSDTIATMLEEGADEGDIEDALALAAHTMREIPDLDAQMKQLEHDEPELVPAVRELVESRSRVDGNPLAVIANMDRFMRRRALQFLGAAGRARRPGDLEEPLLKVLVFTPGWSGVDGEPSVESFMATLEDLLTTVIVDGVGIEHRRVADEQAFVAAVNEHAQRCANPAESRTRCDVVYGIFVADPKTASRDQRVAARAYLRFVVAGTGHAAAGAPARADVDTLISSAQGPQGDALREAAAFTFAEAVAERIGVWGQMPLTDKRSISGLLPSLHAGVSFSDRIEDELKDDREAIQAILEQRPVAVAIQPKELHGLLCDRMKAAGLPHRACTGGANPLTLEVTCGTAAAEAPPYCRAQLLSADTLIYTATVTGVRTKTHPDARLEDLVVDLGSVVAHLLLEFERDPVRIEVRDVVRHQPSSSTAMMFAGAPWLSDDRSQAGDWFYTGGELVLLTGSVVSVLAGIEARKSSADTANGLLGLGLGSLLAILPFRLLSALVYDDDDGSKGR